MTKKEIQVLDNSKLLRGFYGMAVQSTKEVNSTRGITKKTIQQENWYIEEVEKRFGVEIKEKLQDI